MSLSSLFTAQVLAASFDEHAESQARAGRVYQPLADMLNVSYGIDLPLSTLTAIKYINNNLLSLEKPPVLAAGIGAKAAAVTVVQALHGYAVTLLCGMSEAKRAESGAAVRDLPSWADPVAIAAKKAERKDAKKAKADAEAAAALNAGAEDDEAAAVSAALLAPLRDIGKDAQSAWNQFAAFLSQGAITAAQRDSFIAALETATVKAEDAPKVDKVSKRAKKAATEATEKAKTAALLATFKAAKVAPESAPEAETKAAEPEAVAA